MVQHTDPIKLLDFTTLCQQEGDNKDFIPVDGNTAGFAVLMEFFDVVAAYTLKPFRPVAKILPNKLYHRIIDMVDFDTYAKCLGVCDTFRHHVQSNVRLSQQPRLTSRSLDDGNFTHHLIMGISPVDSEFIIFDCVKGRHVKSNWETFNEEVGVAEWVPVIGNDERQSIMVGCGFTVPELASHPLPRVEESQPELDAPEIETPTRFCIPKFAGVMDVSTAWGHYVREKLLIVPSTGKRLGSWGCSPEMQLCYLPSNTASLMIDGVKATKSSMIWLRKSTDFELPPIRQRVLEEAQDYLCDPERNHVFDRWPKRQGLLVIAFGTKAQCFQWSQLSGKPDGVRPVMTPFGGGAVLDVSDKEERKRFEELFWGWGDDGENWK